MKLIDIAVQRPIAVVAAVLMVVMFGLLALKNIPIQLTPDINQPVIEITTIWPGTAPEEIEREIITKQEEVLEGLQGLEKITSEASTGSGRITLEFDIKQDMNKALILVSSRLDQVQDYPAEADKPFIESASSEDSPIAWITLKPIVDEGKPIYEYGTIAEDIIKETLERIPGIGTVNVYGGSEIEMQIIVDPETLAHFKLTIPELLQVLQGANSSISAGDIEEGKRRYIVRTEANFETLDQVREVVVKSIVDRNTGITERIKVSDIATVQLEYKEPDARIRHLGSPSIAINAVRETGANVIETMDRLKSAIQTLNDGILSENNLKLTQVYDETVYIESAIDLVQQNILLGGILAATVLMLFLRSIRATIIVSIAIPASVIGSFVAMAALGRSINVISLAGLAFAVGMVVDAAIIVLENIFKYRQQGLSAFEAAIKGAKEVWGAIFVSALTTVMVFIPLIIMDVEIAQLFRDIAVAISVAVILSLFVAITVIPALATKFFKNKEQLINYKGTIPIIDNLAHKAASILGSKPFPISIVFVITIAAILGTIFLLPKLEYLPEGNRNLVFGIISPPPGYNLETTENIAKRIENVARPLFGEKIENFFFVARNNMTFVGASHIDGSKASELIPILSGPIFAEPGTYGFMSQTSLFGRSISGGRTIDFDISGPDLEQIIGVAQQAIGMISQVLPTDAGNQYRPIPGLELGSPEIRVVPDNTRVTDNKMTNNELAATIKVFNEGLRVDELTVGGKRIDLTIKGSNNKLENTQEIANLPIITTDGNLIPVSSLAKVFLTSGPTQIQHKNRQRTITIQIYPQKDIALERIIEIIQTEVVDKLESQGLPPNTEINLTGTADKLTSTWDALITQLSVAVFVVYLVMTVLFESFFYPLIILFSVPVAAIGGVLGLALLNIFTYQPLDMLTMLGFIILIGIVVNNAILIVHYSLHNIREKHMPQEEAITLATQSRIRPIFMSTLTSIFGMLPLVVFPGAGSELYRGLGSVVLGGLSLSAILTLVMIPSLLQSARAAKNNIPVLFNFFNR